MGQNELQTGSSPRGNVTGDDPFYYLHTNLYVVPVPKLGLPETAIEDLFEKSLLETKIDGKTFDKTNHEQDGGKLYSKFTFATKVVAASKVPVDYTGFEPLLQAMLDVEADYATRLATVPPTLLPAH
jgi:RNA-directed DNA polymerase